MKLSDRFTHTRSQMTSGRAFDRQVNHRDRSTAMRQSENANKPGSSAPDASPRSFLAGAGATALGVGLLGSVPSASAHGSSHGFLTRGDEAILRFLSAAEILETDLWQQYNELGGIQDAQVPGGSGNPKYTKALSQLDDDMPQYIHDNTQDEFSHFTFINAYLVSRGGRPVDLDRFRTLPSSTETGAQQIGRLTHRFAQTVGT